MGRKVILVMPVSDERLLRDFVRDCLAANVDMIAIYGPEAPHFDGQIDNLIIELESDHSRWPTTTIHADDTWAEVMEFTSGSPTGSPSGMTVVHL
jgi:hypothetical protein